MKSIFFSSKDGGELLFYFSLSILVLGRQIEESKFPERFGNVLLLLYLFWKSLDQEKSK